ncbi:MAG: ABC transporter ATP-binding protein [Chitinivibrionales bacterium]
MTLLILPNTLKTYLTEKFPAHTPILAVKSDISIQGNYGTQWLVAMKTLLCVISEENGIFQAIQSMEISAVKKIETASHVGGESMEIETANGCSRIIAYSNAKKPQFTEFIAQLERMIATSGKTRSFENDKIEIQAEAGPQTIKKQKGKKFHRYIEKIKMLVKVFRFARPYKKTLLALFLIMVAGTCFGLIGPYISKLFIDVIFKPGSSSGVYENARWLVWAIALLLIAGIAQVALSGVQQRFSGILGYTMLHDVRVAMYEKLQFLSLSFYDKHQTGALIARVNQDTAELQHLMVDFFPVTIESLFLLAGVGTFLFILSWQLTCVIIVPLLAGIVLLRNMFPRLSVYYNRFFHYRSQVSALVNDTISGVRVVKAFGREAVETARFKRRSALFRVSGIALAKKWSVYYPAFSFFMMLGAVLVWLIGGELVLKQKMTLGSVVAFAGYLAMFYGPAIALGQMAGTIANALSAAERVFEVIDAVPEIVDAPDSVGLPVLKGALEFRDVSFGYEKSNPVINGMSMKIQPFQRVAFVGKSGAGKSTIAQLLCRLYDVDKGAILIDGVDVRKIKQTDLRRHIGVVLQETFLFNGTIYDNIAYAKADASRDEVIAAAISANAHDFIIEKPDAYDTQVGERGDRLSGGEKQRIALARALLHDPAVLILDEATSSVDTPTEKKIKGALDNLSKKKTIIGIAHRVSTLENYDTLFVIDDGAIVEAGTHEELMAKKGRFYDLVFGQKNTEGYS